MKEPLTASNIERLIDAACKEGFFAEDFYFDEWPHVAAKLMQDRKVLLDAAEKAHAKMVKHSPQAILLSAAIESAQAGWPEVSKEK